MLKNSFHGRTLGALHFTRQESVYQNFPTTSIPVYEVERENIEQLEETIINENPIAILLEPVLGSGGIYPLSREYLHGVQNLCDKYNVILIVDEVQSGMGRTGKLLLIKISILHHILFKLVKEQEADTARWNYCR